MEEFFAAIRQGDPERVAALLAADPGLAEARNPEGATGVLWAVYVRHPELVPLVSGGRVLDLYEACATGGLERIREALAADPHAANSYSADGFTPLGLAIFFGHREAARLLLDAGANPRTPSRNALRVAPLHSAVAAGDLEAVRMLIARGAEADPVEFLGATPLHSAAMSGRADIARVLIEAGADPERKTKDQKTALDLAEAGGHAQVAELLRGWRRD
ncbi:MAG TPA: ankyrin repeat domain-containing protein [Bryobacteraceae bacterium]|nr:ankyrin repeat domain-containing protein [Bryobacteraceae bacterium]